MDDVKAYLPVHRPFWIEMLSDKIRGWEISIRQRQFQIDGLKGKNFSVRLSSWSGAMLFTYPSFLA